MTCVRRGTQRNAYVYGNRCRTNNAEARRHNTSEKPRSPHGARAQTSPRRVLRRMRCFSADAQEDCPLNSGSTVQRPASLDVGRSSSSPSTMNTSDDLTPSMPRDAPTADKCITNLSGPTPPLVQRTPPWSSKPLYGSVFNRVDQVDQGNYVSDNTEKDSEKNGKCSRDEGYVFTLVQLVQRFHLPALSGFSGPTHPGPIQGGSWSTPYFPREYGRNETTLVHTLVQREVAA